MSEPSVMEGYASDAASLISRFESLSSADVLAPVLDLLPARASRILEIGAGTGRDAAWLTDRGHQVVAAEPVQALRQAGMAIHAAQNITWIDDRLPELESLQRRGEAYDLILLVAVWQHLKPEQQRPAFSALAAMIAPSGRLIMSLRHGPGSPTRPCYPARQHEIMDGAEAAGLSLVASRPAASVQQGNREAGISWTWLCFDRP